MPLSNSKVILSIIFENLDIVVTHTPVKMLNMKIVFCMIISRIYLETLLCISRNPDNTQCETFQDTLYKYTEK